MRNYIIITFNLQGYHVKNNNVEKFGENVLKSYKKLGLTTLNYPYLPIVYYLFKVGIYKLENIESSEGSSISLNVLLGKKQATLSANNLKDINVRTFLEKAKFMAASSPEDPYSGLPDLMIMLIILMN